MEYTCKSANAEWGFFKQVGPMESSDMLCNQDISRHVWTPSWPHMRSYTPLFEVFIIYGMNNTPTPQATKLHCVAQGLTGAKMRSRVGSHFQVRTMTNVFFDRLNQLSFPSV